MNVLITGGAGFIGTNLCHKLSNSKDFRVNVFDNLCNSSTEFLPEKVNFLKGDILNTEDIKSGLTNIDVIVHLAAFGSVVDSIKEPFDNFETNARGTLNILDGAVRAGIGKVIFASTGGAIMGNAIPPVDEKCLPSPISPYGASKLAGEAYCSAYASTYNLDITCLRFANIYGPYSGHKKGVITKYIKNLFQGKPLTIYGDGNSTRDYLHVHDLVEGIASTITKNSAGCKKYHLASGKETTIRSIATHLCNLAKAHNHPVVIERKRQGEVERNFANFSKAKAELNFRPKKNLQLGLQETFHWFENNKSKILTMRESDS